MAHPELGPWSPLPLVQATKLFADAHLRWWVSGGHALDLHLGRTWRAHDDTDIGIVRSEAAGLRDVLQGWDIHIGAAGVLTPWQDEPLDPLRSQNNLWCRPDPTAPWAIDVTVGDGDTDSWIYKRDHSVRRPWSEVVLESTDGIPYLAPEVQLLFKSKDVRPKDQVDADVVIPLLSEDRRGWLMEHLPPGHLWQALDQRI